MKKLIAVILLVAVLSGCTRTSLNNQEIKADGPLTPPAVIYDDP